MGLQVEHGPDTGDTIHNPFYSSTIKPPIDAEWKVRRELADTLRQLMGSVVTATGDIDTLTQVNEMLKKQLELLKESQHYEGRFGFHKAEIERYPTIAGLYYELSPLIGQSNPMAIPLKIWVDDEEIYGEVKAGWQYEGPPGSLHGGYIAAIFDEFLGLGQRVTGSNGFTGTLTVKYHNLTPLNTMLTLVGKLKSVEGRKKTLHAEMWANDVMTATCEGIFIDVPIPELGI